MSTLINKVKEHISDNRGKYGAATGAGVMYGASKIDSPLINQAGFNILAKGQNLALDTADKIDPRATVALNDLGMHKIRQEDIDASNALYNSGVAKFINPNPVDMVNANEHSTEVYNKAMAAKANAQDALVNAKNQGQDYIDQGINYIKGLNPFTENTINIPIKDMLFEGYTPEAIVGEIFETIQTTMDDIDYSKFKKNSGIIYNTKNNNQFDKAINNLPNSSKIKESFLKAKEYRIKQNQINQNNVNLDSQKKEELRKLLNRNIRKEIIPNLRNINPYQISLGGTLGGTLGYIGDTLNNENNENILNDKDSNADGILIGATTGATLFPGIIAAKTKYNSLKNYIIPKTIKNYRSIRKSGTEF